MKNYLFPILLLLEAASVSFAQKPEILALTRKFKTGETFVIRQTQNTETEIEINSLPETYAQNNTMEYGYQLDSIDTAGRGHWTSVYKRIIMSQSNGPVNVQYDSADPAKDTSSMLHRLFFPLLNRPMYMISDPQNRIVSFRGADALFEQMLSAIDQPEIRQVMGSFRNMLNDSIMLANTRTMWGDFYPDKPVALNDQWSKEMATESGPICMTYTQGYTLQSRDRDETVVTLKTIGIPTPGKVSEMSVKGLKFRYHLQGSGEGLILLNSADGMLKSSSATVNLSGTMEMVEGPMEMKAPMKTKTTVMVEVL